MNKKCFLCNIDMMLTKHHVKGGKIDDRRISRKLFGDKVKIVVLCHYCHIEVHLGKKGKYRRLAIAEEQNEAMELRSQVF